MTTFLRREKALACPIHTAVRNEAAQRLEHSGVFSKEEVLEALDFEAMADSIRWDYIREFLEEAQGCELIPLASTYFRRHKREEEFMNTSKFIAQGYGKKTAGFAAVIPANDHFVVTRVAQRKKLANGTGDAFRKYVAAVSAKRAQSGLSSSGDAKLLTACPDGDSLIA